MQITLLDDFRHECQAEQYNLDQTAADLIARAHHLDMLAADIDRLTRELDARARDLDARERALLLASRELKRRRTDGKTDHTGRTKPRAAGGNRTRRPADKA